jgi:hypothetical protein
VNAEDRLRDALSGAGIIDAEVEGHSPSSSGRIKVTLSYPDARKLIDLLNERREP